MPDWKIVLTLLIVLAVIGFFASSTPAVSSFFSSVGSRMEGALSAIGLRSQESGTNEFALELSPFGDVQFEASGSSLAIRGSAEARVDRGIVRFSSASLEGFSGRGSLSSSLQLNGSADSMEFDSSVLEKVRVEISSPVEEFSASGAYIRSLSQNSTQGELALRGSVTRFTGSVELREARASLLFYNGTLRIEGNASKISVPGAGIMIG